LLRTTNHDKLIKRKSGFTFENFVIFIYIYIYIYIIQIVQKNRPIIIQGDIWLTTFIFNSLKFWKQLGWIDINKWGLNPWIKYLREKFLLETSLISKEKKMLIFQNNLYIFKWNKTYLHLYEIGKTQRFQKTLKKIKKLSFLYILISIRTFWNITTCKMFYY
jgi:hypothetical protein